jgi:hypothetical protein
MNLRRKLVASPAAALAEAHNRAAMTDDSGYKRFLLDMEERWLRLGQSMRLSQSLTVLAQDGVNQLA